MSGRRFARSKRPHPGSSCTARRSEAEGSSGCASSLQGTSGTSTASRNVRHSHPPRPTFPGGQCVCSGHTTAPRARAGSQWPDGVGLRAVVRASRSACPPPRNCPLSAWALNARYSPERSNSGTFSMTNTFALDWRRIRRYSHQRPRRSNPTPSMFSGRTLARRPTNDHIGAGHVRHDRDRHRSTVRHGRFPTQSSARTYRSVPNSTASTPVNCPAPMKPSVKPPHPANRSISR